MEGEIPGAGVIDLVAAEGFFVLGKAVPGVFGIGRSRNTPEIESLGALILSVENHLDEENGASHELAMFGVGAGMSVVADAVVIVDEGSSDGLAFVIDDVEGGEAAFELVLEVAFGLGREMVAGAETV